MSAARKVPLDLSHAVKAHVTESCSLLGNWCLSRYKKSNFLSQPPSWCRIYGVTAAGSKPTGTSFSQRYRQHRHLSAKRAFTLLYLNSLGVLSSFSNPGITSLNPLKLPGDAASSISMTWCSHAQIHCLCGSETLPKRANSWLNSPQSFGSMRLLTWSLSNSQAEKIQVGEKPQKMHFQHWHSPMPVRGPRSAFHQSSHQHGAWEVNQYSQTHAQE